MLAIQVFASREVGGAAAPSQHNKHRTVRPGCYGSSEAHRLAAHLQRQPRERLLPSELLTGSQMNCWKKRGVRLGTAWINLSSPLKAEDYPYIPLQEKSKQQEYSS